MMVNASYLEAGLAAPAAHARGGEATGVATGRQPRPPPLTNDSCGPSETRTPSLPVRLEPESRGTR